MLRKILKFNFYLLVVALILGIFLNDESSMKIVDGDLMYSTTHLNVRSRPDADSKKVNVLQPNTPLITSLSDDDNWMVVAGLDSVIIGYSSSKYLSVNKVDPNKLEEMERLREKRNIQNKQKTTVATGCVTKDINLLFCMSESYLNNVMSYIANGDLVAVQSLIDVGACSYIAPNIPIFIESSTWSGKVEIRPKGSITTVWTVREAIECN